MSFSWPQEVLEHAERRNLVLVVGAGISSTCENSAGDSPPKWADLLRTISSHIGNTSREAELEALIAQNRLLEAAELLGIEARTRSRLQDFYGEIKRAVDGPPNNNYLGSAWHEAIVRSEARTIVTTNYDKIIERATSSGYGVHEYTSSTVGADIRRNYPVLLKIHGSVDHVEDMVLTRRDYTDVRVKGRHAMEVLHAVLLTRPALLIGYSLHDPDLQLILENIFGGQNQAPAHYMLASDDMPDYERRVLEYSYGVTVIDYPNGDHDEALARFSTLADLVQATPPSPNA